MDDLKPQFGDHYAQAVLSGNLRQREFRISHPDTLMAFAMVDTHLSTFAYRPKVANDPAAFRRFMAMHRADVKKIAEKRHWAIPLMVEIEPNHREVCQVAMPLRYVWNISDASLEAWVMDVCPACTGRRMELMDGQDGRRVLSDVPCKGCGGSGKSLPVVEPLFLLPFVGHVLEILTRRFEAVGRAANKKLKG